MRRLSAAWSYITLAACIIFLDRLTKQFALANCVQPCIVNRFLSFECVFNRGVSWGLLDGDGSLLHLCVLALVGTVILIMLFYTYRCWKQQSIILGETMLLAGAFSNLFDRFHYRGVIDYIHLSCCGYSWPNFNIADMFIVCGVFVMIIEFMREE